MADKYVYDFSEGNKDMRELLGGKGANLAEMTVSACRCPPASPSRPRSATTTPQRANTRPASRPRSRPPSRAREEHRQEASATRTTRCCVSVRSGARVSMPGMMDTILNLGLNDTTVQGLIKSTSNPRFGYDCYRRFVRCTATSCWAASRSTKTIPTRSRSVSTR